MRSDYRRVIPRDLFNESKLLKCLGQLALLIHDGFGPQGLEATNTGDEFRISQDSFDGNVYVVSGVAFTVKDTELALSTPLNSKESYPLLCKAGDEEIEVFDDERTFTDAFCEYIHAIYTTPL